MGNIGSFGGMFDLSSLGVKEPILVSGTDGVGTKLKIAFAMDKHDTIGIDAVAMCVNDVLAQGAEPLIFLDYVAIGHNIPEKVEAIVAGVAEGCRQAGCALVGGETAEMPGFYPEDEYDLAGFSVGIVDKSSVFDKQSMKDGDIIIALPSSGVHSNGFSLVRKVFGIDNGNSELGKYSDILGSPLGETLLTPTNIYVRQIMRLKECVAIKSVAHITGGGFYENIPRCLAKGKTARIERNAVKVLPIFELIKEVGSIDERDMFNTFNMGVGMCVVVAAEDADKAICTLREIGTSAYVLGEIITSDDGVVIC